MSTANVRHDSLWSPQYYSYHYCYYLDGYHNNAIAVIAATTTWTASDLAAHAEVFDSKLLSVKIEPAVAETAYSLFCLEIFDSCVETRCEW